MTSENFKRDMNQALDLGKAMGTMAEKRNLSPMAMHMAAANSLASCLATAAMLHIVMARQTKSEAIAGLKEAGIEILAHVMEQALYKLETADVPTLIRGYNEKNPKYPMPEPEDGWDD